MQQDEIDKIIAEAVASSKKQSKWHRQDNKKRDVILRARQVLNAVFMLGFLAAIIIYFAITVCYLTLALEQPKAEVEVSE